MLWLRVRGVVVPVLFDKCLQRSTATQWFQLVEEKGLLWNEVAIGIHGQGFIEYLLRWKERKRRRKEIDIEAIPDFDVFITIGSILNM